MPPKKQPRPDTQAKVSQGRHFGGRNRQNDRGGRARRPKREPVREASGNSATTWGEHPLSPHVWGEVNPSGWGAEHTSGWAQADDDWAMEAYTGAKIEAWIQQVEACSSYDIVRTPSATSDGGTTPSTQPIRAVEDTLSPSTHQVDPQLHRWALDFLNRTAVSADHRLRALQFLSQSREQQFQTIYALLQELSAHSI